MREFHYVFSKDKYPGVPKININLIDNTDFFIGNTKITPIEAHYKLPVFGFRIDKFVYLTDVSYISSIEKQKLFDRRLINHRSS